MIAPTEKQFYRILELPKHLQNTVITLMRSGRATALDIAAKTGKARAVESAYLNMLVVMKLITKERQGRRVYFSVDFNSIYW